MRRIFRGSAFVAHSVALLALFALASVLAFGQATSGDIVGTVFDKSDAVVPGASIVVLNESTGIKTTVTANGGGEFRAANLLPGSYSVTASSPNFRTSTVAHFLVQLNHTGTVTFHLEPGKVTETIEVTSEASPIDTTTAQISTTYETKELSDAPTSSSGSGVLNLALQQGGVASSGAVGAGSGPSVGGQRPRNNNFTIEGVDNNDKGVTGPSTYIPNDAVQEFSILQNQFSPEFGHSTGGQFNVAVKSGTNSFHGVGYEYFQNRNLDAINAAFARANPVGTPKPRFDNNRFGGQLGGPIYKNKLFFFVNYEYNPVGQVAASNAATVPTAAGFASLASNPLVNQTTVSQLQKYITASKPCTQADVDNQLCTELNTQVASAFDGEGTPTAFTNVELGSYSIVAPAFTNNKAWVASMDFNISDKDQVRARWIYNQSATQDVAGFPQAFFTSLTVPFYTFTASEFHTFSPSAANELRVGFHRTGQNFTVPNVSYPGLDSFPNLTVFEGNLGFGPDGNAPQFAFQNYYSATDNFSVTKGNHSLKFGVEGRKYISPQKFIQRSRGDYQWNAYDTFFRDIAQPQDDGNGLVFAERSFGNVGYSGDQKAIYWFVNDNWRVTQHLSVNLGLRYEYTGTPFGWTQQSLNAIASVPGLITFGAPQAPKKDFAPRIGFAYSPGTKGDWSIRGGFGIGYDVLYDNIGVLSRPPQIGSTTDCPDDTNPGCPLSTGAFLSNGGIVNTGQTGISVLDQATARANTSAFLPNKVKYPQAYQWNLGVQHTVGPYTVEVRYVGTRGVHLNVQNRINVVADVTPTANLPVCLSASDAACASAASNPNALTLGTLGAAGRFDPAYSSQGFGSNIVAFEPWGASTYHGLTAQVNRRLTKGLQGLLAYTYSHNIDNSTADFFSTVVAPRRPQDFRNLQGERGNSALDHRQRLTIAGIYELPFFKNGNWLEKNILGNWEISPSYTYETGGFGTVQSGRDVNLNGDAAGDRVQVNPGGVKGHGTDTTAIRGVSGDVVAYFANDPTAQYFRLKGGALANSGRGNLLGDPINNLDLAAYKRINITERFKLEFGAQFLNAINHSQYIPGSPNDVLSVGNTGALATAYLRPGQPNFNNTRATFGNSSRTGQLSLKVIF